MKPSETESLYTEACRARRISPQAEEGREWHKQLRQYELKDVRTALDAWTRDTTQTKDGTPRGKWLPAPAELTPLVEKIVRDRETRAAIPRYYVRWLCPKCSYSLAGYLAVGESGGRTCSIALGLTGHKCGTIMEIVTDERPRS